MIKENPLRVVTDSNNHWLWYGRGKVSDAKEGAEQSELYDPKASLFFFTVAGVVVVSASGD